MPSKLSRSEAHRLIEDFFRQTEQLDPSEVKKMKNLAMKHNIKLGKYRTQFCNACHADLRKGSIRVSKTHKTVTCESCGKDNKIRHR